MTANEKIGYEIDLTLPAAAVESISGVTLRPLNPGDREALAKLLLDAYAGTIDDEGETMVEALEAIDDWLDDAPMLDHSPGAEAEGRLVSAVLMMRLDGEPFLAIVATHPDHKGRGVGRAVVAHSLDGLRAEGHERVRLFITRGNTASERLFARLGARPISS